MRGKRLMREFINAYTIGAVAKFVKRGGSGSSSQLLVPLENGLYRARKNGYNEGSLSAEVAELADA